MKLRATAVLLALCFAGCDESFWDTGDPGKSEKGGKNLYTLSCDNVKCPSATDRSTYSSGDNDSVTCTWHCAKYKGKKRYVSLTFWAWDGGCYELDSEYKNSCI